MAVPAAVQHQKADQRDSPWYRAWRRFLRSRTGVFGALLILTLFLTALFAPWLAPMDPTKTQIQRVYESPSAQHWMGTDEFGRDVLSRVIYGSRIVVTVAVSSTLVAAVVGIMLGLLAGYYRGFADLIITRLVDLLLAFPAFLLAVALVTALGPSITAIVVVIGITRLPRFIRMVRGEVLRVIELDYVAAARAVGARDYLIMLRHILPNCLGPILVLVSLTLADSILTVSGLSFLGIGIQPPTADWGVMLTRGRESLLVAPYLPMFPGAAIFLTVMGFNLLGDALRDALDPRGTT
jgi:peptide/nickel transport system permease protein